MAKMERLQRAASSGRYFAIVLLVWIRLGMRFFFGTLWGVFLFSACTYVALNRWSEIQVFSSDELLIWFSQLSEGAQVAASAGVLTAVGLVAAYWTAMSTWRLQRELEHRIAVGADIHARFETAQRCVIEMHSYLCLLIEATSEASRSKNPQEASYALRYTNEQAASYRSHCRQLHEARMHLNGIFSAHGATLSNVFTLWDKIRRAIVIIDEAWAAGSFVPPHADPTLADFPRVFLSRYDHKAVTAAVSACDRVIAEASALSGFVRGVLMHPILPTRLASAWFITRKRAIISPAIDLVRARRAREDAFPTSSEQTER